MQQQENTWGQGSPFVAPSTPETAALEQEMFVRLNRDRAQQNLPALAYLPQLADIARAHSLDMRQNNLFDHTSPTTGSLADRLSAAAFYASTARENLAIDSSIQSAQDHLLQSPGHYANIMADNISHIGIGVVVSGPQIYVTQVFASPITPESPAAAREQALRRLAKARTHRNTPSLKTNQDLDALTARLVAELPVNFDQQDLQNTSNQLETELKDIAARSGLRPKSIQIAAQTALRGADIQWPDAATLPQTTTLSLAISQHPDPQGRPTLIALIVLIQE
jgi:uncharacterized protein YkwD